MLKLNGTTALASQGHTDLGALRFHGAEAAKAGGRAMRRGYEVAKPHVVRAAVGAKDAAKAGYRRAKPHVEKAAAYAWEGAKSGARRAKPHVEKAAADAWAATKSGASRGAAAVRAWLAKPNDARFADAPAGARFADIEWHDPRRFSVRGYHPTLAAAHRALAGAGPSRGLAELPARRSAKRNDAAAAPLAQFEAAVQALVLAADNTATIYFGPIRAAEVALARKFRDGQYQREHAARAFGPAVEAAVAEVRRETRGDPDRRLTLDHAARRAAAEQLAQQFEAEGYGQHWLAGGRAVKANGPDERAPAQLMLGFGSAPPFSKDDTFALHELFYRDPTGGVDEVTLAAYDVGPARRAIINGLAQSVRGSLYLTRQGQAVVAAEAQRIAKQVRQEEAEMGRAMRRGMDAEDRRAAPAPAARAPRQTAPRAAAGRPAGMLPNQTLAVLSEVFGDAQSVPSRMPSTQVSHVRKCLKAGLVTLAGDRVTLTDAGRAQLAYYRDEAPRREAAGPAAGTPTNLNMWVLSELFRDNDSVPNQLPATEVPHIRRCLKAGLVTASRSALTLTDTGRSQLAHYRDTARDGYAYRERPAKPNHHGGHHDPGDPLGVYLPKLSERGQWLSLGKGSGVYWTHPALYWEFRVHDHRDWNEALRNSGEVRAGRSFDAPVLARFRGDPASVYDQMTRWYASLTRVDVSRMQRR